MLLHCLDSCCQLLQLLRSMKQCVHSSMQQRFQALDQACEFGKSTISDSHQCSEVIVQHDFLGSNGAHNVLEFVDLFLQAVEFIRIVHLKTQVKNDACTSHNRSSQSPLRCPGLASPRDAGQTHWSGSDFDMSFAKPTANVVFVVWRRSSISQFCAQLIIPVSDKQSDQLLIQFCDLGNQFTAQPLEVLIDGGICGFSGLN